jgi:hypothetical protein
MLKLNVNPMRKRWTEIQQTLAKAIIKIGTEVLKESLHIKCKLSPLLVMMAATHSRLLAALGGEHTLVGFLVRVCGCVWSASQPADWNQTDVIDLHKMNVGGRTRCQRLPPRL